MNVIRFYNNALVNNLFIIWNICTEWKPWNNHVAFNFFCSIEFFSKNEWTCKNPPEICEVMTRPANRRKTNMRYGCLAFASRHVQYLYTTYNAQAIGIASKILNRYWKQCLKIHPSPASQMFGFSHMITSGRSFCCPRDWGSADLGGPDDL